MTSTMNNFQRIESMLDKLKPVFVLGEVENQPHQICLACRNLYGLVVQSLAWADEEETKAIYELTPEIVRNMEVGLHVLGQLEHELIEKFKKSVTAKIDSLSSLSESKSLEQILTSS